MPSLLRHDITLERRSRARPLALSRSGADALALRRIDLLYWGSLLLLLGTSFFTGQFLQAATVSKLSVSAVVLTQCNLVVSMLDGLPSVSNQCGQRTLASVEGRAVVTVDARGRSILVEY